MVLNENNDGYSRGYCKQQKKIFFMPKYAQNVDYIKAQLINQYLDEQLGDCPHWFNKGFAKQYDTSKQDFDKNSILRRYGFSNNFNYIINPDSWLEKQDFKRFNYLQKWLNIPGNSLNKLVYDINSACSKFKFLTVYEKNNILYDYIMRTGGSKILQKFEKKYKKYVTKKKRYLMKDKKKKVSNKNYIARKKKKKSSDKYYVAEQQLSKKI